MQRRSRFALIGLLLALISGFQGSAEPRVSTGFSSTFVWRMDDPAFGGFSGLEVLDNGRHFVALSDKATFLRGRFLRDASGKITAVRGKTIRPLIGAKAGQVLSGKRADSEGLAIDSDGNGFISFEGRTRIARFDPQTGIVADMTKYEAFARLPKNGGLEALAVGPGPIIYALPEQPPTRDIPVYRWQAGQWDDRLSLPRRGQFVPVGADIGPDGRLYLLERDFRGIGGFASRLRRFDLSDAGLEGERILFETPFAHFDNLEGLSVWRDDRGVLYATMISDDNFFFLQKTQIVEFRLPD